MPPFSRVTVIGLGLIGSSIARGIRARMPDVRVTGYDASAEVRDTARAIDLCDAVPDSAGASVAAADLVVLCVPVGALGAASATIADALPAGALVSPRSEEPRLGQECVLTCIYRWEPYHRKKK